MAATDPSQDGLSVNDAEAMSLLIGDIYDASLDETLWPRAFDRIRDFLGECTASVISQHAVTKEPNVYFMLGHEQTMSTRIWSVMRG